MLDYKLVGIQSSTTNPTYAHKVAVMAPAPQVGEMRSRSMATPGKNALGRYGASIHFQVGLIRSALPQNRPPLPRTVFFLVSYSVGLRSATLPELGWQLAANLKLTSSNMV